MASLNCRHCNGVMSSESRKTQCPHCGALFPFVCAVGGRNLRPPFPVYPDERHLSFTKSEVAAQKLRLTVEAQKTVAENHQPLSDEHHLRQCPDCGIWFLASENPGNFRCPTCAKVWEEKRFAALTEDLEEIEEEAELAEPVGGVAVASSARGLDANLLVMLAGAGALVGLVAWFFMKPQ